MESSTSFLLVSVRICLSEIESVCLCLCVFISNLVRKNCLFVLVCVYVSQMSSCAPFCLSLCICVS